MLDDLTAPLLLGTFLFLFGSCIGSFLNVVAHRVPLHLSVISPRSHCPNCKTQISGVGLIPILGFLILKARCQKCKLQISYVYPLIEFLVGAATVFIVFRYFPPLSLGSALTGDESNWFHVLEYKNIVPCVAALWFLYTGVPLSMIDIKHRLLPNVIVIPGTIVSTVLGGLNPNVGWMQALIGVSVGLFGLYAIARVYEMIRNREGMGMGDVKYLAFIGGLVGWQGVIWTLALASLAGSFYGISLSLFKKGGLNNSIPFGPFLFGAGLFIHLYLTEIQTYFGPR